MKKFLYACAFLGAFFLATLMGWFAYVPSPQPEVVQWPVSPTLFDRQGNLLHVRLSTADEYCIPVPLHAMGDWLPKIAVAIEDKRFYDHFGVDTLALARAVVQNVSRGKTVSGASTISSQLVRIAIPRSRVLSTKALEFTQAILLEQQFSKSQILELYLNRAPMGGTLRGVEAAARGYFGKTASQLSLAESALLVGMFKGPTYYRPDLAPQRSLSRRNEVLDTLVGLGIIDDTLITRAKLEPLPVLRPNLPTHAWHFAELAFTDAYTKKQQATKQRNPKAFRPVQASHAVTTNATAQANITAQNSAMAAQTNATGTEAAASSSNAPATAISTAKLPSQALQATNSTLLSQRSPSLPPFASIQRRTPAFSTQALHWTSSDAPIATTLHSKTQRVLEQVLQQGIQEFPAHVTSVGAVVDNASGELIAYVGNSRFSLQDGNNWVNCGIALRSPGSTLKPFLFAEAFDKGILLPGSLLADTPLSFAGKAPRNYDRSYRGPVLAGKALALSLNVPAVRVLRMLGQEGSLQTLHRFGFEHLQQPAQYYGDSLVLGGCEVTLLEVAHAYTALGRQGKLRPLIIRDQQENTAYPPVYTAPSAQTTTQPTSAEAAYLTAISLQDNEILPEPFKTEIAQQQAVVSVKTGTSYGLRDAWAIAYSPRYTIVIWVGAPDGKPHPNLVGGKAALPLALHTLLALPPSYGSWQKPAGIDQFTACSLSGKPATPFCPSTRQAERIAKVSNSMPCTIHKELDGKKMTILPAELVEFAPYFAWATGHKGYIEIVSPRKNGVYLTNPLASIQKLNLKAEGTTGRVYWFVNQEFFGIQEEGAQLMWPMQTGKHTFSLVDEAEKTAITQCEIVETSQKERPMLELTPVIPATE